MRKQEPTGWNDVMLTARDDRRVPRGCNPEDGRLIFSANSHQNTLRLDIASSTVMKVGGSTGHHWVSLDGRKSDVCVSTANS